MSEQYQQISVDKQGEVVVLGINAARIDQYETATELRAELLDAVAASGGTKFVLEMGNLRFMSSVGYLPFLKVAGSVNERGGRLFMCNVSDVIKEMFTATQLLISPSSEREAPFRYAETLDEAVAALA